MSGFADSISGNLEIIGDLLSDLPPSQRSAAREVAAKIERFIKALSSEYPGSTGAAIGAALALHLAAQRFTKAVVVDNDEDAESRIILPPGIA